MLIVDTGPLVATADRADRDQAACRELLESEEDPLVTTPMVIAEAGLYASIIDGQIEVADLGIADWQRIQDLVSTYADLRLGGTDASVVVLAERYGVVRIATLNRRHFAVVRPRHADAFELLP